METLWYWYQNLNYRYYFSCSVCTSHHFWAFSSGRMEKTITKRTIYSVFAMHRTAKTQIFIIDCITRPCYLFMEHQLYNDLIISNGFLGYQYKTLLYQGQNYLISALPPACHRRLLEPQRSIYPEFLACDRPFKPEHSITSWIQHWGDWWDKPIGNQVFSCRCRDNGHRSAARLEQLNNHSKPRVCLCQYPTLLERLGGEKTERGRDGRKKGRRKVG